MLLEHVDDKMGEWVSVKVGGKIAKTDLVARFARLVSIPLEMRRSSACAQPRAAAIWLAAETS